MKLGNKQWLLKSVKGGHRPKLKMPTSNGHISCSVLSYNDPVEEEAGILEEFKINTNNSIKPVSNIFIDTFEIPK